MRHLLVSLGVAVCLLPAAAGTARARDSAPPLGIFEEHTDVGTVLHSGSVGFHPEAQTYTVAGSGENMWASRDAFQFVWKKVSGDLALTADISFLGTGKEPHRKACLLIRQS